MASKDKSVKNAHDLTNHLIESVEPFVPAHKDLPQITLKAFVLGVLLALLLGASNAYLGLKIGQTVTACIPAAVISMCILRLFRTSNILENNIVQTTASAGEVIAAASIFTLPALLIIGYWSEFSYLQTTLLVAVGGTIGVLYSIPLRHALIVEEKLPFPEGVATAELLMAGEEGGAGAKKILEGGVWAALLQFGQSGLQLLSDSLSHWTAAAGTVMGFGAGLSSVMLGAGYIVGLPVGVALLVGAVLFYGIGIPLYGLMEGVPEASSAADAAMAIKGKLRYVGVGAMMVGGGAALIAVLKPIRNGIRMSFNAFKNRGAKNLLARTERDIPVPLLLCGLGLLMIPLFFLLQDVFTQDALTVSSGTFALALGLVFVLTLCVGFLMAAVAGYMSGLVGVSATPLSGVLISGVLLVASLLLVVFGTEIDFSQSAKAATGAAASVVLVAVIVACIAVISADNLQDLKSGQMVGATPWKQQVMLIVGVVVTALVIAPVLQLLFQAYGMGGISPREGMDISKNLAAPQAVMIATVAKGVFARDVPLHFLGIGAFISLCVILFNKTRKSQGKMTLPVLAVALGLYLPLGVSVPMFLGGLLSFYAHRRMKVQKFDKKEKNVAERNGLLFASGLISGEAIIGIVLAIPFVIAQDTSVFRMVPAFLENWGSFLGFAAFALIAFRLFKVGTSKK